MFFILIALEVKVIALVRIIFSLISEGRILNRGNTFLCKKIIFWTLAQNDLVHHLKLPQTKAVH